MRSSPWSLLLALVIASWPALASADASSATDAPGPTVTSSPAPAGARAEPAEETIRWYGWQPLLLADVGSVGILVVSRVARSDGLAFLAAGDYVLASSVVHLAHGHPVKALGALALRGGLPVLLAVTGYAMTTDTSGGFVDKGWAGLGLGVALGVLTASVIDDAWLARETVPAAPSDAPTLRPTASALRGGATIGLAGSF